MMIPRPIAAVALSLVTFTGCPAGAPSRGAGAAAPVRAMAVDTSLRGSFEWIALDGRAAPAEFPPGSGASLVAGALELRADADPREQPGRFGLRFTLRRTAADSARTSGEDGAFRVVNDSLHFVPDGRESQPPVRFRYAWGSDGTLALTDTRGHVWIYRRR